MSFKIKDRVTVRRPGSEDQIGRIKNIIPNDVSIYIVELDDKSLVKCLDYELTLIEDPKTIPDTIMISRSEFRQAVAELSDPKLYADEGISKELLTTITLSALYVGNKLEKRLFDDF